MDNLQCLSQVFFYHEVELKTLLSYFRTFIYSYLIQGGKPTPIGICALAFIFCTVNGYIQVRSIQLTHFADTWLWQPIVVFGVVLFCIGLAINIHSDHILRSLRKPGETGYKIPRGKSAAISVDCTL